MIISELSPHIVHDAALPACREPIGSLRTGERVTLAISDPLCELSAAQLMLYGDESEEKYEMSLLNGRWSVSLSAPETPAALWYCFRLSARGKILWLCAGENGRFGQLMSSRGEGFRLTVYERDFETPEWFRGAVMYQIFPDRFARDSSGSAIRGADEHRARGRKLQWHEGWDEPVCWQPNTEEGFYFPLDFYGGTLRGIKERLGYIKELGVDVIYLNPIFEAASNHRYDTADYMRVDPILGDEADFRALCDEAAALGIRIMLDGVFSHTGADSRYFNKFSRYDTEGAYNAGERSPYYAWYDFREFPDKYRAWWDFPDLPEVDENNAEWRDFVISGENSVVRTWLRRGASGWRLDVADELPDEALELIREAAKEEKPDAVILGEVWEDAVIKYSYGSRRRYALGNALDSVMNYPFRRAAIDFFTFRTDSRALRDFLLDQRLNYPAPMYAALMNLLSSHDCERIRTALATKLDARQLTREQQAGFIVSDAQDARGASMQRLAAALQFALPGVPCIYYGDECGMGGMLDPFDRAPFAAGTRPLKYWYTALSRARHGSEALKSGTAAFLAPDSDVICIQRVSRSGSAALCAINRSAHEKSLVCDIWQDNAGLTPEALALLKSLGGGAHCPLSGERAQIEDGLIHLTLPPESVRYFIFDAPSACEKR